MIGLLFLPLICSNLHALTGDYIDQKQVPSYACELAVTTIDHDGQRRTKPCSGVLIKQNKIATALHCFDYSLTQGNIRAKCGEEERELTAITGLSNPVGDIMTFQVDSPFQQSKAINVASESEIRILTQNQHMRKSKCYVYGAGEGQHRSAFWYSWSQA